MHFLLVTITLRNHSIPVLFYRHGTVIVVVPKGVAHLGTLSGVSCHIIYFFKMLFFASCMCFSVLFFFVIFLFIYFVIVCRWLLMLVFHFCPMGECYVLAWKGLHFHPSSLWHFYQDIHKHDVADPEKWTGYWS